MFNRKKAQKMQNIVAKSSIELDYIIGDHLGRGQFGITKTATSIKTGEKVAVKIITKSSLKKNLKNGKVSPEERLLREVNLLKLCNHPNIAKYIDFYADEFHYYIVMEYLKDGELFDYIIKFSDGLPTDKVRKIFAQVLSVVEYCHGNLIAHRDIKPENILLKDADNLTIKLIDFGLANYVRTDGLHNSFCGSPEYTDPEILNKEEYNPLKADIWSIGVLLHALATGSYPYKEKNILKAAIEYKIDLSHVRDADLADLLSKILVRPNDRFGIPEIY